MHIINLLDNPTKDPHPPHITQFNRNINLLTEPII
jgi:hypothetical protein